MASRKSYPINVRTLAALPAAGEYDATGLIIDTRDFDMLEVILTYTQGAEGGCCKMMLVVASSPAGPFGARTIDDGTINLDSGLGDSYSYSYVYVSEKMFPVNLTPSTYTYIFDVSTARFVQLLFAEFGATGTPGTVEATCVLGAVDT